MLNDKQIEQGKAEAKLGDDPHHEHPDCIRIAFEWLDAQARTSSSNKRTTRPLKHLIENWANRYVSQSDVEVAAYLHPDIIGTYPHFNISSRLIRPNGRRLKGIQEAGRHSYTDSYPAGTYKTDEP